MLIKLEVKYKAKIYVSKICQKAKTSYKLTQTVVNS